MEIVWCDSNEWHEIRDKKLIVVIEFANKVRQQIELTEPGDIWKYDTRQGFMFTDNDGIKTHVNSRHISIFQMDNTQLISEDINCSFSFQARLLEKGKYDVSLDRDELIKGSVFGVKLPGDQLASVFVPDDNSKITVSGPAHDCVLHMPKWVAIKHGLIQKEERDEKD